MEISNENTFMTIDFYESFHVVFEDEHEKMQFLDWIERHGEIKRYEAEEDQ